MFLNDLINCFFSEYQIESVSENDLLFDLKLTSKYKSEFSIDITKVDFSFIQPNDIFNMAVTYGENDSIQFLQSTDKLEDFKDSLENVAKYIDDDTIVYITIIINKKRQDTGITIYDINIFEKTISSLSISQIYSVFDRAFSTFETITFNVLNIESPICTETIFFVKAGSSLNYNSTIDRVKRKDAIKTLCHYSKIDEHKLIPDDFKIKIENPKFKKVGELFNTLCISLSIIFLFDITSLEENELEFKINGYKSIKGKSNLVNEIENLKIDYFEIYDWVYTGGNLIDKIGLARNIISLHLSKTNNLLLNGNPFQSIKSSYKVYEKQNIKQYIEIRNKISDQLLEFNNRANKVIETFASGFQKSSLALISFYTSAIVIRVLGKGEFTNIFTPDATILSIAFIIISYIYFHYSKWEVKEQRRRFVDSYTNLKERYTDLLEEDDIKRILNNDKEFNSDLKFIDDKLNVYSKLWFLFLLILLIVTISLFLIYNLFHFLDTPLMRFFFKTICDC